jgi:hypothetical protein
MPDMKACTNTSVRCLRLSTAALTNVCMYVHEYALAYLLLVLFAVVDSNSHTCVCMYAHVYALAYLLLVLLAVVDSIHELLVSNEVIVQHRAVAVSLHTSSVVLIYKVSSIFSVLKKG